VNCLEICYNPRSFLVVTEWFQAFFVGTVAKVFFGFPGCAKSVEKVCFSLEVNPLMSSIEDRVKKIVVEQLGANEDQVTTEASFVDDLGADSLDTVELVMALEEEFDMEIPDDQAENIGTVKDAVGYIEAHTSA